MGILAKHMTITDTKKVKLIKRFLNWIIRKFKL